jgi:hypothetical protein
MAAAILVVSSCRDFLELVPETNVGMTGTFYKNTKDLEYALTSAYAGLQASQLYQNDMVLMTDVRSDDLSMFSNSGGNSGREYSIKIFTANSDNQIFRNVWAKHYAVIYRCNNVIASIDVATDAKLKAQYEAEARFLRALCYFNLVRLWGDAPLILEPLNPADVAKIARSSVAEIYSIIEADLLFAADPATLPKSFSGANAGRATSLAAKGLLGKVYLQQKMWSEAKATLEELINTDNGGVHALLSDIANVFSTAPAHGSAASAFNTYQKWEPQTMNKEIMFAVLFNKDIASEGRAALTYYSSQADLNPAFKATSPTVCIYNTADRRSDLMRSIKGTNNDNALLVKYADIQNTALSQYGYHTPILRWADVLLMYAEASNEVAYGDVAAMAALNAVRTRSFANGSYTSALLATQAEFRDAVLLERRLEFPMEMQRWFDLVRTGRAISAIAAINLTISEKDFLFPIPQSEISLRNDKVAFPQNPGY